MFAIVLCFTACSSDNDNDEPIYSPLWSLTEDGVLTISGNGAMPNYDYYTAAPWMSFCESIKTVVIVNGITSIGDVAFSGCRNLVSITIPNSVVSIGSLAFYECSGLTSIVIPNSVTSIETYAFCACINLTSVTLPKNVKNIKCGVFSFCFSLPNITIPNNVTSIEEWAFDHCSNLRSITIPNSVTSIEEEAFGNCSRLTSIEVAADNPNYASENGVLFNKAKNLLIMYPIDKQGISYTIPNSVINIENRAFSSSHLTSITIPDGVTSIGEWAFSWCGGLTEITVKAIIPPYVYDSNSFEGVSRDIPVYVPQASLQAYRDANVWKTFTNLQGF